MPSATPGSGSVVVVASDMHEVIEPQARVEQVCTGFRFCEGPLWNAREQALYFSDMPGDVRRRWSARDGVVEARRQSHKCNGMTYDEAGNLYVCEHETSALVRETPDGARDILATHYQGRALNSPNDVIVRSDGMVLQRPHLRAHAGVRSRAPHRDGIPGRLSPAAGRRSPVRPTTSTSRTAFACRQTSARCT